MHCLVSCDGSQHAVHRTESETGRNPPFMNRWSCSITLFK
jgi:hypothetical protein